MECFYLYVGLWCDVFVLGVEVDCVVCCVVGEVVYVCDGMYGVM